MPTFSVIKDLDIFEDRMPSLLPCLVTLVVNQFSFKRVEKAFRNRIIPSNRPSGSCFVEFYVVLE